MKGNKALSKESSDAEIRQYFEVIFELKEKKEEFPVDLDLVWPLVYSEKGKAVRTLKDDFLKNIDYKQPEPFAQNGERSKNGQFAKGNNIKYHLSIPCLEYFIARKVRPVFEVYRQVFHGTLEKQQQITNFELSSPIHPNMSTNDILKSKGLVADAYQKLFACQSGISSKKEEELINLSLIILGQHNTLLTILSEKQETKRIRKERKSVPITDSQFNIFQDDVSVQWLEDFFAKPYIYNCPIDLDSIIREYKTYYEYTTGCRKHIPPLIFKNNLQHYCNGIGIAINPDACLNSATDRKRGYMRVKAWKIDPRSGKRILKHSTKVLFFCKIGEQPETNYDVKELCRQYYLQPDPESVKEEI